MHDKIKHTCYLDVTGTPFLAFYQRLSVGHYYVTVRFCFFPLTKTRPTKSIIYFHPKTVIISLGRILNNEPIRRNVIGSFMNNKLYISSFVIISLYHLVTTFVNILRLIFWIGRNHNTSSKLFVRSLIIPCTYLTGSNK